MSHDTISLFVKVEGNCHSNHRNPKGVYTIEVSRGRTMRHSACAAMDVARDHIPFMSDRMSQLSMRVFQEDGHEVIVPRALSSITRYGCYRGRTKDYPLSLTM